jgi:cytochrome c553
MKMLMSSPLWPRTHRLATWAMLLLMALIAPAAAADTANGSSLFAENCADCHGAHGEISNDVVPNILGQYPGYLLTQMQAFLSDNPKAARAGVAGSLKRSILLDLSVSDIRDIVSWLGTIEYTVVGASKEEAESRGELAANGWWLANFAGCGNCHGDDFQGLRVRNPGTGELDPDVGAPFTPKLVGLKHDYLMRQLRAYQDGRRAGGLSGMKHIMAPLFQTPRMMQAIGGYAEGVSLVPLVDGSLEAGK